MTLCDVMFPEYEGLCASVCLHLNCTRHLCCYAIRIMKYASFRSTFVIQLPCFRMSFIVGFEVYCFHKGL